MYKTAEELGIEEWEHQSLINMVDKLESLKHVRDGGFGLIKTDLDISLDEAEMLFNMDNSGSQTTCGTVACIGGWCAIDKYADKYGIVNMVDVDNYVWINRSESLSSLFFPAHDEDIIELEERYNIYIEYDRITNLQAKQAVINFLTTGKPMWATIIPLIQLLNG